MKKVKIFIIVMFLILLSGCDATYELNIKNDKITEKLTVIETDKSIFDKVNDAGWTVRDSFEAFLTGDDFADEDYKAKSLNTDDELGIEYTSSSSKSVDNLSILNQCYTNYKVNINDDIVTVDTGTDFGCYEYYENLDKIKVILKTNHKVISTNADSMEDGSYIWNITKEGNKQIQISYYESIVDNSLSLKTIMLIVGIIVIIGIAFVVIYNKIKNKNNI